jgi:hypothetical protein
MKIDLIKNVRAWSVSSAVLAAVVYAGLALTSEPAYAGTCTATFCKNTAPGVCAGYCISHGQAYGTTMCTAGAGTYLCFCARSMYFLPC